MNGALEPKLPLKYDNGDGPYKMITLLPEMIHQNLKNLFLTNPGEKIFDLFYGVGIKSFLFENVNSEFSSKLNEKINQQIYKYMPYIKITNLKVNQVDNQYNIIMKYSLNTSYSSDYIFSLQVKI